MRKLLAISLLLFSCSFGHAQDALVVATCGTLPSPYSAGSTRLWTVDTNGKLCGSGGGGTPGGSDGQVQYNNVGAFGGLSNTQLTARINAATAALSGALPAWPNNTTTFFRGDGTYVTLNAAALSGLGAGVATALGNTAGGAGGFALVGTTPPTGVAGGALAGTYPNPTLASTISAGGPTGSATVAPIITYNAAGQLTAVSSATITPAIGSVTGLGSNVATFLATPSSANLAAAVTDESGNGALLFANGNIGTATGTSLALNGATISANVIAGVGQFASFGATTTGPGFYSYLTGDTVARVRIGLDTNDNPSLAFGPGGATTRDTFLMRIGAGTIQHGTADVDTAPVAQIIRTQGALAGGTSNVAGANMTIIVSPGKGTGVGGSFIVQTTPAGSTGTAVNAPVTAMTINSTQDVVIAGKMTASGTASGSNLSAAGAGFMSFSGRAAIESPADGTLRFENNAGTNNFILSSPTALATPTMQHGALDAAVAVPQIVRVQSVVAGTAAANGANWTLVGSLPTGTGTSGDIIIQTGVKTGSGTTQGTATTALTIKGETQNIVANAQIVLKGYTVAALPTGVTGGMAYVTDAVACTFLATVTGGGAAFCPVIYNGTAWVGA